MSVADNQVVAQGRQRVARDSEALPRAMSGGQPMLGVLLGRGVSWFASWVAPVGRGSLYVGLLLVAFTALRLPGDMGGIADVFLLVSVVCAVLRSAQGRGLRIGLLKTHAIGLTLVISGVLIGTVAESSEDWRSLLELAKFLFATTATIVTCMVLLEQRSQLKIALGCWVVSAAVTSAAAMLPHLLGDSLLVDSTSRAKGLTVEPNHLGAVAGMAIGGALSLAVLSDRVRRALWLLAALLCIFGVVASASRAGAVIALASVGLWAAAFYRSNKELTMLVVGCCLAGAALASFVYVQLWSGLDLTERLASATDPSADGAVASRLDQYQTTFAQALQSPLVGVGLAHSDTTVRGMEIHNTMLMLFRAGGILSLLGIVVIFADLVQKSIVTYLQAGSPGTRGLVVGLGIGVVGLVLDGLVEPVLYQRQYWIPSALLLALIACRHPSGRPRSHRASKKSRSVQNESQSRRRSRSSRARRHGREPSYSSLRERPALM